MMTKHVILGTDFSKAITEIIQHAEIFKAIGVEKISLIHVCNLRDVMLMEQFSLEDLQSKLKAQEQLLS
jgi:hypothetical protein